MEADLHAHVAFYLTGKRLTSQLDATEGLKLRPSLFSGYRDLTRLRYDFPLVLVSEHAPATFAETLSGLIDSILDKIACGGDGERIRKHVMRLEQDIRSRVACGEGGLLSELWDRAAPALAGTDTLLADSLSRARANLEIDGELIDCDANLPAHVLGHAWGITQRLRASKFSATINRLVLKLSEIIKADFVNSSAGKSAESLKAAFGTGPLDHFNFELMSRLLTKASPKDNNSAKRQQRINGLLSVLQSQKLFPASTASGQLSNAPYSFAFDTCSSALEAYHQRLPETVELARAVAMAEMEIKGEYNAAKHDPIFESFGKNGLDANEMSLFPDYLVRINACQMIGAEQDSLDQILSAELPIKVLVQTDDLLEASPVARSHLAFSLRSQQLASKALGLCGVFVLQTPASNLYSLRTQIQRGLDFQGPALFSVFSGATPTTNALPPYLLAAAALEARAFPVFCNDPSAGEDWASRFSLATNPQATLDWPVHELSFADEEQQLVSENIPFTLIDFVACDTRYSTHFARLPKARWNNPTASVCDVITRKTRELVGNVPCLLMIDAEDHLQKIIVDEKMIREARRFCRMWNSLQELGGIHNSHADKLLASERTSQEQKAREVGSATPTDEPITAITAPTPATQASTTPVPEAEPEHSADEAYIETPRCSTCNECVQINGKMFVFDNNKQAYIADISSGTYAQLVEAAENCQVSIIHPGKPRNPNEPGLEDLLKRAEAFM